MATQEYSESVIAYTAGIMERASFVIHKTHEVKKNRKERYWVDIKVTVHSESLADWLFSLWGMLKIQGKGTTNPSWICRCTGSKALYLADQILPYLITKRNNALILNLFTKVYINNKQGKETEEKSLTAYKILRDAMMNLNEVICPNYGMNVAKIHAMLEQKKRYKETFYNNIFDFFDGSMSQEESTKTKGFFDDFLKTLKD